MRIIKTNVVWFKIKVWFKYRKIFKNSKDTLINEYNFLDKAKLKRLKKAKLKAKRDLYLNEGTFTAYDPRTNKVLYDLRFLWGKPEQQIIILFSHELLHSLSNDNLNIKYNMLNKVQLNSLFDYINDLQLRQIYNGKDF